MSKDPEPFSVELGGQLAGAAGAKSVAVRLPDPVTLADLLVQLAEVPGLKKFVLDQSGQPTAVGLLIAVNGVHQPDLNHSIQSTDDVFVMTVMAGG